jgi:hypothetical protein
MRSRVRGLTMDSKMNSKSTFIKPKIRTALIMVAPSYEQRQHHGYHQEAEDYATSPPLAGALHVVQDLAGCALHC